MQIVYWFCGYNLFNDAEWAGLGRVTLIINVP